MSGPLTRYAEGFEAELLACGYRRGSVDAQLLLVARLDAWLVERGLDVSALTAGVVAEFVAPRAAAGLHFRTERGLAPLLAHLRSLGVAPAAVVVAPGTEVERLLERYRVYLVAERGLAASTAAERVRVVAPLLVSRVVGADGGLDLGRLRAQDISAFVVERCRGRGNPWARQATTALRSLLTFLHVEGMIDADVAGSVPSVANWRLSHLPPRLAPGEVRRLLDSCDPATVVGCRDRAILTVLARLGLRAGEVAALSLDDIDWRAGVLRIYNSKRKRHELLPLPADVGEAIADYLTRGRPQSPERSVFLRVIAPAGGMSGQAVSEVVRSAARRCGMGAIGSHALRHAAATDMLRAGAPLIEIGQVLRHRLPRTTAIYAKVDLDRLRQVARPWPAGAR
jgi:site-specific recombinase XerD